jgi:hypothetical protein
VSLPLYPDDIGEVISKLVGRKEHSAAVTRATQAKSASAENVEAGATFAERHPLDQPHHIKRPSIFGEPFFWESLS